MSNQQPAAVLLIEDEPEFATLVQQWLSQDPNAAFAVTWKDTLAGGLQRLSRGGIDIVLLDLWLSDSSGAATFLALLEAAPGIPLIVLSGDNTEGLALQMISEGAEDYLVKNSCNAELLIRALRYAVTRHVCRMAHDAAATRTGSAKVIGVIGAKGGVGTTTVASTLAADLGKETGEKTLLCDFDFDTGLVAFFAGVAADQSIQDATENISRLDHSFWQSLVQQGPCGIDILAAPRFYPSVRQEARMINEVLVRVRRYYDWIVLDMGRQSREAIRICELADELLLVTSSSIASLYEAKRFFGQIPQTSIERHSIRVIVNDLDKTQRLSSEELSTVFGSPVCGVLPSDAAELRKACLEQRLPQEPSAFRREMVKISRGLANLPDVRPKRPATPFFFLKKSEEGRRV